MNRGDAVALVNDQLLPQFLEERRELDWIDGWARWEHDDPSRPAQAATAEYRELAKRAEAPWGDLIVTAIAQTLFVNGYRRVDESDDSSAWRLFLANGQMGGQVALHRAALTYGHAYSTVLPGRTLAGESMPVMRNYSPRDFLAYYDDPAVDIWPQYGLRVRALRKGWQLSLLDDTSEVTFQVNDLGGKPTSFEVKAHDVGVCPVVRFTNRADLEGRVAGEVEPYIPILGKIDQTSFDRLVVQRFASWVVKTISGMSVSESAAASGMSTEQVKLRLAVEDLLTAEDPDTRFGSLPATPLDGFIRAHDADLSTLAAVSQTPAFELLGQMANLSAEALAAAKASQTAKSTERQYTLGEQHAQRLRLASHVAGDAEGAADFEASVRWADTSIRSLAQAADALGKIAQMLGMPVEVLWPKIPGFTQQDVDEAKRIAAEGGPLGQMMREISDFTALDDPTALNRLAGGVEGS